MTSADFGYCVSNVLSGLSQNRISRGLTFVNLAADWRIFVRIFVLFASELQILSYLMTS